MRYARLLMLTAIIATLVAGCNDNDLAGPGQTADHFDWRGTIAPGELIEIKNINGNVKASFTSGSEVVVHAIKTSEDSDLESVTIEVVQHAQGVTICAVYPDVPGFPSNECLPGLQGNMTTRDNDVNVEFTRPIPFSSRGLRRRLTRLVWCRTPERRWLLRGAQATSSRNERTEK